MNRYHISLSSIVTGCREIFNRINDSGTIQSLIFQKDSVKG